MITFPIGSARFTERVAAACLHDGHVLAHKSDTEDFWALPGGRVEIMESSDEALCRELREELGIEARPERLLWIVENFFRYEGHASHELGFYYLVSLEAHPDLCQLDRSFACLDAPQLRFQWLPLAGPWPQPLLPVFLQERLLDLPLAPEHLVCRETTG